MVTKNHVTRTSGVRRGSVVQIVPNNPAVIANIKS